MSNFFPIIKGNSCNAKVATSTEDFPYSVPTKSQEPTYLSLHEVVAPIFGLKEATVVENYFCSGGSLLETLLSLAANERRPWLEQNFYVAIKTLSDNSSKIILTLQMKGGGCMSSKMGDPDPDPRTKPSVAANPNSSSASTEAPVVTTSTSAPPSTPPQAATPALGAQVVTTEQSSPQMLPQLEIHLGATPGPATVNQIVLDLPPSGNAHPPAPSVLQLAAEVEIEQLPWEFEGSIKAVAVSSNGKTIATAGEGKAIDIWSLESGESVRILEGLTAKVISCAYSPDDKYLVAVCDDNSIYFWNLQTDHPPTTIRGQHSDKISTCTFSPDSKTLALGSNKGIRIMDMEALKLKSTEKGLSHESTYWVMSPDGKSFASANKNFTITIWNVQTKQPIHVLIGHVGTVTLSVFSPDSKYLVTASIDKTILLWDLQTGKLVQFFEGHTDAVTSCSFHSDGKSLVSGSLDKTIRFWTIDLSLKLGHIAPVISSTYSLDGTKFATGGFDHTICVWNAITHESLQVLEGNAGPVLCCTFSPDGRQLASAHLNKTVCIWNLETGKIVKVLKGHTGLVSSCIFSKNGKHLVSTSEDKTARLWDLEKGEIIHVLAGHKDVVYSCAFSPNGLYLATTSADKTVIFWDLTKGIICQTLQGNTDQVRAGIFLPNGDNFITAGHDKIIRLWKLKLAESESLHEEVVREYKGHENFVTSCAISHNGGLLASTSSDSTVRLWDPQTAETLHVLQEHMGTTTSCAFSPDDKYLITTSHDRTVHLWLLEDESSLAPTPKLVWRSGPGVKV